MDQSFEATARGEVALKHEYSANSMYSFYQPQKDERLVRP